MHTVIDNVDVLCKLVQKWDVIELCALSQSNIAFAFQKFHFIIKLYICIIKLCKFCLEFEKNTSSIT